MSYYSKFLPVLMGGEEPIGPLQINYLATDFNNANLTTYTFSDLSIGTFDDKFLFAIFVRPVIGADLSGITFGGISATRIARSTTALLDFYIVDSPGGSTADLVVTMSGSGAADCSYGMWELTDLMSTTPVDTQYDGDTGTDLSVTIDVPVDGAVIAARIRIGPSGGITWVNATERYEETEIAHSGADRVTPGSVTIEANMSSGASGTHAMMAVALR